MSRLPKNKFHFQSPVLTAKWCQCFHTVPQNQPQSHEQVGTTLPPSHGYRRSDLSLISIKHHNTKWFFSDWEVDTFGKQHILYFVGRWCFLVVDRWSLHLIARLKRHEFAPLARSKTWTKTSPTQDKPLRWRGGGEGLWQGGWSVV